MSANEPAQARSCSGAHDELPNGYCAACGQIAGSVLDVEPYDFPAARRELLSVHAWIGEHGLQQHLADGQWGHVSGYYEPEWIEAGNTVEAIQHIMGNDAMGSFYQGLAAATQTRESTERIVAAIEDFDGVEMDQQTALALAQAIQLAAGDWTGHGHRRAAIA